MTNKKPILKPLSLYSDAAAFQASLEYTARNTGFQIDLIEKDYFCSMILMYLAAESSDLIFKGGTCLNKVHVGFYRLSEDLDFTIPIPSSAKRSERQKVVAHLKSILKAIETTLMPLTTKIPLTGSNKSRQYNAEVQYPSVVTGRSGSIKIEIGLREELLEKPFKTTASTLLQNPFSGNSLVHPFELQCLSKSEAYAEKVRAALTRKEPAIRDYFDIDHAVHQKKFDFKNQKFLKLVEQKLKIPSTSPVNISDERIKALRSQIETELRPVLRDTDFKNFDIERALKYVHEIAGLL